MEESEKLMNDQIKEMIKYVLSVNPEMEFVVSIQKYFKKYKKLSEKQFDVLTEIYMREKTKHS